MRGAGLRAPARRRLLASGIVLACVLLGAARPGVAAPPATPKVTPPPSTLGAHAAILEGTWELVSMKLPDGTLLKAPVASGVIVIDKGVYLAASYVQPSPERKVGNVWEGRMILDGDTFQLVAKTGYRYDSAAEKRVEMQLPPKVTGKLRRTPDSLVFEKDGGGKVTFLVGSNRRVQEEADGTVIEHVRTSVVPRMPEDLPGR